MVKNPSANAGDVGNTGLIPGWGRSPGGKSGNPLQYSCWGNPMDRWAWRATVHGVIKRWTWLRDNAPIHTLWLEILLIPLLQLLPLRYKIRELPSPAQMNCTNSGTCKRLSRFSRIRCGERSLRNNRDLKKHKESLGEQTGPEAEKKRHLECQQKLEKNLRREATP